MHFFIPRKKVSWLLTIVVLLTLVAASWITSFSTRAASAASAAQPVVYHSTTSKVTRLSTTLPSLKAASASAPAAQTLKRVAPLLRVPSAAHAASTRLAAGGPTASSLSLNASTGGQLENFQGLSDADQGAVAGGSVTPPDQGLAVGSDPGVPGQPVVFEAINDALRETAVDGSALPSTSLLGGKDVSFANFWEPGSFSDPRVFYDASTQSFYFTDIGAIQSGPDQNQTSVDIAVYNAHGFAVYQIDSSLGGQFFGDQPHVGYDNNGFYISVDGFNAAGTAYNGALLFVIPKTQLVTEAASLSESIFGPLSLGGIPVLTLQPAISTSSTNTEYLLNSFPFADGDITPNTTSHELGFWKVTQSATGFTLSGKIIQSETYAFPVNAASTGTGAVDANGITSEQFLNPDDSRLEQVQFINGHLWTSLNTAISIGNDPADRDGAAWFEIDTSGKVVSQGFVASAGNYLLYPVIWHNAAGATVLTFSITSSTLNPSAAYAFSPPGGHFRNIQIASQGSSAHTSFADFFFNQARWGDYSAAAFAPNGKDFWLATEYIPDAAHQDAFDNWGTRVFEVAG